MTSDEIKERGNSVISRALLAVVLIQFFILRPPLKEDRELSGLITEAEQRLLIERESLKAELEPKSARELLLPRRYEQARPMPREAPRNRSRAATPIEPQKIVERLTKIELDLTTLAKARPRREFKIPGTDSAIDERDIRHFYPAAIAALLTVILGFRRAISVAGEREFKFYTPPYWASPFVYSDRMSFALFVALNSVGITVLLALSYLYVQFMYRDDVFQSVTSFALNAVAGVVAFGMLVDAVVDVIRRAVRRE